MTHNELTDFMIIQVTQVFTLKCKSTMWDWVKLPNLTNGAENAARRQRREICYTSAHALILLLKGAGSWVSNLVSNQQMSEIFESIVRIYTTFTVYHHNTIERLFFLRMQCPER